MELLPSVISCMSQTSTDFLQHDKAHVSRRWSCAVLNVHQDKFVWNMNIIDNVSI